MINRTRIVIVVGALFLLTACTPQATNINTTVGPSSTPTPKPSPTVNSTPTPTPAADNKPVAYVDYENRAVGYRIQRPDKWHWQHLIRNEIGDANALVDDYFITDRNPLPALGTEYLGMIVIEVSRRTSADIAPSLEGFEKTDATVGGQTSTRYEGIRNNQVVANQKWIEYQFTQNDRLFRFLFAQSDVTPADIAIFEEVVRSFTFNP